MHRPIGVCRYFYTKTWAYQTSPQWMRGVILFESIHRKTYNTCVGSIKYALNSQDWLYVYLNVQRSSKKSFYTICLWPKIHAGISWVQHPEQKLPETPCRCRVPWISANLREVSRFLGFFRGKKNPALEAKGVFIPPQDTGLNKYSLNFRPYFHGYSTNPPNATYPPRNKGLIAGLIKGNQWVFISPDHTWPGDFLVGFALGRWASEIPHGRATGFFDGNFSPKFKAV